MLRMSSGKVVGQFDDKVVRGRDGCKVGEYDFFGYFKDSYGNMRGEFRCSFEGTISATTKRELERCGYTVIMNSQYNQSYVIIKWY